MRSIIALVFTVFLLLLLRPSANPNHILERYEGWEVVPNQEAPRAEHIPPSRARVERIVHRSAAHIVLPGVALAGVMFAVLATLLLRARRREVVLAEEQIRFVGRVSHELKTPLTNIRLYAELLEDVAGEDLPEARAHARVIVEEACRLSRLISNVLTFNSPVSARRLSPIRCSPDTLVDEVLEQFRPSLSRAGIVVRHAEQSDLFAVIDPDVIKQILGNLVSNVEKYAADGKYLAIWVLSRSGCLTVAVHDRGPGVAVEDRERIFEPFVRGTTVGRRAVGTGIGLSNARELAHQHGGDLTLEYSPSGALFMLSIPGCVEHGRCGTNQPEEISQ